MDNVTTIATVALAAVGCLTFLATWRLASATAVQAQATQEMLTEAKEDRELRYRPYLISDEAEPSERQYEITNSGTGPALQCVGILYDPIDPDQQWFETEVFQLGPTESVLQTMHAVGRDHIHNQRGAALKGLGDWEARNQQCEILVCTDIFGKQHRFQPELPIPELLDIRAQQWKAWFDSTPDSNAHALQQGHMLPPTS